MNLEPAKKIENPTHHQLGAAVHAYTFLADIRHEWPGRNTVGGNQLLIYLRDLISKATGKDPQDVQNAGSVTDLFQPIGSLDVLDQMLRVVQLCDTDEGSYAFGNRVMDIKHSGATLRIIRTVYGLMQNSRGIRHALKNVSDEDTVALLDRCVEKMGMERDPARVAVRILSAYNEFVPSANQILAGFQTITYQKLLSDIENIVSVCWIDPASAFVTYKQFKPIKANENVPS